MEKELVEKISSLNITDSQESPNTAVNIREEYQYNTKISLGDAEYLDLLNLAMMILDKTKEILEEP